MDIPSFPAARFGITGRIESTFEAIQAAILAQRRLVNYLDNHGK